MTSLLAVVDAHLLLLNDMQKPVVAFPKISLRVRV